MIGIVSNLEALKPVVLDKMMANKDPKETSSIPMEVFEHHKTEGRTSVTLGVDEPETWAKKFFNKDTKPVPFQTKMSSKASKTSQPDNQIQKTVKTEDFSSNSKAPEMMKNKFIPGLFVEKPKLSKRAQRANKFKVMRLQEKVITWYRILYFKYRETNTQTKKTHTRDNESLGLCGPF